MNKRTGLQKDLKEWALELVQVSRLEFKHLIASIPAKQRDKAGELKKWSPKDELAHLAYWLEVFVGNIRAKRKGKPLTDTRDYLAMNDAAWEVRKGWSLEQIEAALEKVLGDLEKELKRFTLEELTDPAAFALERPRPFVRSLLYELIDHPMHHWAGLYRKLGKESKIGPMLGRILEAMSQRGIKRWTAGSRSKISHHARG